MDEKLTRAELSKIILEHYSGSGWNILETPKDSTVDFIAAKGDRMHFIKIIEARDSVYLDGIAKNTYIQNAFSNAATPVYAIESSTHAGTTYRFINPNTETRVRIGEASVVRAGSEKPSRVSHTTSKSSVSAKKSAGSISHGSSRDISHGTTVGNSMRNTNTSGPATPR
jgi:hypothetical protein